MDEADFSDGAINELAQLLGLPERVQIGCFALEVKGITLGQLPDFQRLMRLAEAARARRDDEGLEAAEMAVVEMITGQTREFISLLPEDQQQALMAAAQAANRELFQDTPPASGVPRGAYPERGLHAAIASLVEAGHSPASIEAYTLGQIMLFCRAHAVLATERQIHAAIAARAGAVDAPTFKKVIGDLQRSIARLSRRG